MNIYEQRDLRTAARAERTGMNPLNASVPAGWDNRVDQLIEAIYAVDEEAEFIQVKTKFGGFRCYGRFNEAARLLVEQAETDLKFVCWYCGGLATEHFHMEPACADHGTGFDPGFDGQYGI